MFLIFKCFWDLLLEQNSLLDELFSEDHAVLHVDVVVGGAVDQEQLPESRRRRVEVLGTVENVAILETVKFVHVPAAEAALISLTKPLQSAFRLNVNRQRPARHFRNDSLQNRQSRPETGEIA